MSTIDQREAARYRQDVLASYRAWLAYLEAQQTLLAAAAESQRGLDPFEGLSPSQERAEAARRRIATLPADRRELFDAIYEQERQQIQRQLDQEAQVRGGTVKRADPDEVARRALTRLHEEARGLHRDDRRGMLPRGKPDTMKWLALDLAELEQSPPSETDYQIAGGRRKVSRSVLVNLIFAGLALIAIPILIFLLRQPGQQATASSRPTGNGEALTPWSVTSVGDGSEGWSLETQAVDERWPAACHSETEPAACWLDGSFRPLELCLPAARLAGLATLRVNAANGLPARLFTLADSSPVEPDLVLHSCDGKENTTRHGRLQALEPLADLAPGKAGPGGYRVTTIVVQGRGADPSLPDDRLVLSVTVEDDDAARDWVALAPTILLADGTNTLPGATERTGATIRFDYLIPNQTERFEALWFVAGPDQAVRYRVALDPPPARDAFLRAALQVEGLSVSPSQQTMSVQLTIHNTASAPLTIVPSDFSFQTQTERRDVAAPTLQQPLAPDERRAISLDLPLESGVLQIGPFRYELAVRR